MKKTKKQIRQAKITRAMKLTWDSLISHTPYYTPFDRRCIREYSEILKILADLL